LYILTLLQEAVHLHNIFVLFVFHVYLTINKHSILGVVYIIQIWSLPLLDILQGDSFLNWILSTQSVNDTIWCIVLFAVLGIEHWALCMLGKCSIPEPQPQTVNGTIITVILYKSWKNCTTSM
jgi:hypothetical protein